MVLQIHFGVPVAERQGFHRFPRFRQEQEQSFHHAANKNALVPFHACRKPPAPGGGGQNAVLLFLSRSPYAPVQQAVLRRPTGQGNIPIAPQRQAVIPSDARSGRIQGLQRQVSPHGG